MRAKHERERVSAVLSRECVRGRDHDMGGEGREQEIFVAALKGRSGWRSRGPWILILGGGDGAARLGGKLLALAAG